MIRSSILLVQLGLAQPAPVCRGRYPVRDVAELCSSDDPVHVLVGRALCVWRGEELDLDTARAAWSRMPEQDRRTWVVLRALIPEL